MFHPLPPGDIRELEKTQPVIIVPFREQLEQKRGEQLQKFVKHFEKLPVKILVVEQTEGKKFNKGALLNIGAKESKSDSVIFHDVDVLPKKEILPYYAVFPEHPIHIGKAWSQKYDMSTFLGGVISISLADLKKINGFPNNFWGWGGEDDAMRERFKQHDIKVFQPTSRTGFRELKHVDTKSKPEWKNMEKWEGMALEKAGKNKSGYKNVKYSIVEEEKLSTNANKITVQIL